MTATITRKQLSPAWILFILTGLIRPIHSRWASLDMPHAIGVNSLIWVILAAANSGAMGYLIKYTAANSVCPAIWEVHKGNTFFSPSISKRLYKQNREK
jgi:hypothetical protein